MKTVRLGDHEYYVREVGEPVEKVLMMWIPPGDPVYRDHSGVSKLNAEGTEKVEVKDPALIALVKAAVEAGQPKWERQFRHLLDEKIQVGAVKREPTADGMCWVIHQSKKDVFEELAPTEITLSTFESAVQKPFKHKGLHLKWASPGGRPKRVGG